MNISKENVDALNAVLTIEFEKADYEARVEKAIKDYGKKVAVKGFRPGHAPVGMIKKVYGTSILIHEIDGLVSETLSNYIKDNNIDILGEPLPNKDQQPIDFDKEVDKLSFKFDLGLSPEINVTLNQDIKVPSYTITIDDKAIDDQIKNLTSRFGNHEPVESASNESLLRGVLTVGEKTNDKCLASVTVIKDEAEKAKFVGKKVGESVEFDIRKAFPDDTEISYLAGVTKEEAAEIPAGTVAKLEINEVSEFKEAEVNKALFDKIYPNDNIADEAAFREKVKSTISSTNELAQDYRFNVDARKALTEKAGNIELPEEFLKRWLTAVNQNNEKFTPEVLTNEFPKFVEDLKWQVIKNRVAKDNEVKIEYADVFNFAKKSARAQFIQYGITNFPEEQLNGYASNMIKNDEQRRHLTEGAVEDKIFALVREKVTVEQKDIDNEAFNKLFEAEK